MKTKFVAGVVATLVAILVIVGIVVVAVIYFNLNAENKILTYGGAFLTIAIWGGTYNKLKPKEKFHDQSDRTSYDNDFHN